MTMVSQSQLERLFERARSGHLNEAEFYSHLLNAMVYVHVPVSDDSDKVRLIQFRHPSGFDVIPVFTSDHRCDRATSRIVKALRLPCIELFKATRGATLMVNPNDGGPVLYPEEVTALLEKGRLETFEMLEHIEGGWDIRLVESPRTEIADALRDGAVSAPFIKCVYLLEKREASLQSGEAVLLVYLGVESAYLERAARHMILTLQSVCPRLDAAIDLAAYDIAEGRPAFLDQIGATPVFEQPL